MHNPHLHFHVSGLFPRRLSRSMKELFGSVAILGFALSAATLFEPIYLYSLGYDLKAIILFYLIAYGMYAILLPLGGKFIAHAGYERGILLGSSLLIVYYVVLYAVGMVPALFFVAPLLLAIHKIFYWIGFHTDFALSARKGEIGRDISEANLVFTIVTILGPVSGAAFILKFGFPVLFIIVAVLILLSNIPLFRSYDRLPREKFSYTDPFRRLLSRPERRRFFTYMGYGEEHIFLTIWPVFLFLVLGGVLAVGIITTAASFFASILLLSVGRSLDIRSRINPKNWGVAGQVATWLVRIIIRSGWQLFLVDAVYRFATGAIQFPLLDERYTTAKAHGIVGSVVLFEMGLAVGKVLIMLVLLALIPLVGTHAWGAFFWVAAIFSLFYALLPTLPATRKPARS